MSFRHTSIRSLPTLFTNVDRRLPRKIRKLIQRRDVWKKLYPYDKMPRSQRRELS